MSYPPPQDNVHYHPVAQGQSYGKGRNTPGQGYPNQDQWAPQKQFSLKFEDLTLANSSIIHGQIVS